ncbi:MAG: PspC domain-containing protein [Ruminococcus sp.]|jgi:phage shock protein PspC (stress-responsive transcriptional regulator)|uniref:PspC domain-containing protein n=1 Tax=Ruminococcus sp. TaxID=41978 RepID=UPI0025CBB8D2|nr:PspC domain-containing protein [Ruminococcus sp.]MCR5539653.1 PspC domain-containing protein [Ruminococcus sp.]
MEKKLYRIRNGSMLAGVCTGLAAYFNIDVNLIRLGVIILTCVGGIGVIPYIAAAIILPEGQ